MKTLRIAIYGSILLLGSYAAQAQVDLASSTADWRPILLSSGFIDPINDLQANNAGADLVGSATTPGAYWQFYGGGTPSTTDGELAFRVRLDQLDSVGKFAKYLNIGIDGDLNGSLDYFLMVTDTNPKGSIDIYAAGTGANTAPSTTTIQTNTTLYTAALSSTNYLYQAVSASNDVTGYETFGGSTDYFLSFKVPFSEVVKAFANASSPTNNIAITEASSLRFVIMTSNQINTLNVDIGGISGNSSSTTTWSSLGVITTPLTSTGTDPLLWLGNFSTEWSNNIITTNKNWTSNASGLPAGYLNDLAFRMDFAAQRTVTFDDTATTYDQYAGTETIVDMNVTNVAPSAVTINNSTLNYVFQTNNGFGIVGTNSVVKTGSGIVTMKTPNTYSGGTTMSAGTIRVGHNTALGTGTMAMNGGTLSSDSTTARSLANNFIIGADVTLGDATNTGALTVSGTVGLGSATRQLTVASDVTLSGTVSSGGLTKAGSGALTLSGDNSYASGTTLSAGRINLNSATAIGTGTFTISGGSIDSSGAADVTLTSNNAQNWNSDFTFVGTKNLNLGTGAVTMNASRQVTVSANNLTVGGAVSGSNYGLTKTGSGKLTLGGANTYSGSTTINAGTLALGTSASIANSPTITVGTTGSSGTMLDVTSKSSFSVLNGQTLKGIGTVNIGSGKTVTVDAGGHWAPGNSVGSNAVTGNLTMSGTADFELGTPGATSHSNGTGDFTAVSGTLTLGGSLNLIDNANANSDGSVGAGSYKIFTQTGTPTGSFSSINALGSGASVLHPVVDTSVSGSTYLNLFRLATTAAPGTSKNLGNVRVGTALTGSDSISNTASGDGFTELLKATVTGNGTGFTGVAGGSSGTVNYSLATSTAGAKTGSADVTLKSTGAGTFSDTTLGSTTTVSLSGGAYDYANPNYTASLDIGNVRVGASRNHAIANSTITSATYQDSLDVSATNGGNTNLTVSNPGNITAGNSGNISYTAAKAGSLATTSSLGFTSNANGVSGLSSSALTSGSVSVTGAAYDYAQAKFNGAALGFGYVHQDKSGVAAQTVAFGNSTVTSASYQDLLDVSATTGNDRVTALGFTGLAASGSGATTQNLSFSISSATTGTLASTASLTLTSNANSVSGLSNGTAGTVGGGAITTSGYVYSGQSVWNTNGNGNWSDFGKWVEVGGAPGLDSDFLSVDTATFGSAATSASPVVTVNQGASVKTVAFDNASHSYTVAGSSTLTMNGGAGAAAIAVTNGTHTISAPIALDTDLTATVNHASDGLIISGGISGAHALTKQGSGKMTLRGSNAYTGITTVKEGELNVNGSISGSDVTVQSGALLSGSGSVKTISGAGTVSPGNSPGILTAESVDPSAGTTYNFEFTQTGSPDYKNTSASKNDMLYLTGGTPFQNPMTGANTINVFFNLASLSFQDEFRGAWFSFNTEEAMFQNIKNANYTYWAYDADGTTTFNGVNYSALSSLYPTLDVIVSAVHESAAFQDFTAAGTITQFSFTTAAIPEPTAAGTLMMALAAAALRRRIRG